MFNKKEYNRAFNRTDKAKAYRRAKYKANGEAMRAQNKAWRTLHPNYMKEYHARKKAEKLAIPDKTNVESL